MKSLVEIIDELSLDNRTNHTHGTDKEVHKYCSTFYDKEFEKYQDKPIKLLEIGLFRGGSLILWENYFSQAEIIGIDVINFGSKEIAEQLKRCKVFINDAYSINFSKFLPKFDIMIDDGPHTEESQMKFLEIYIPRLNDGGVMVIEDIQKYESTEKFKTLVPDGYTYEIVDTRHLVEYPDNIMFIVRK
jgi:cephalosporin hydroxylase